MSLARLLALTVALLAAPALAKRAPAFDVRDLEGNRYTLEGLSGKVVVLRFWFKDCNACRSERGELNRVVARYQANPDVVFLAFALDKKSELKTFLLKNPLRYAVVADTEELADAFNVSSYPTHVIIGRDGSIARRWVGAVESFYRLTEAIEEQTQRSWAAAPGPLVSALPAGRSPAWEPILLVRPERPLRGAVVKIFYAPSSMRHPAEAQLAWDVHARDSFTQGSAPMRTQGVLLAYELRIPRDATLIHLRVLSREDKRLVEHTLPIHGTDGQPVRGAFINVGACDSRLPVERELEHYPDSPFALLEQLEESMDQPGAAAAAPGQLLERLKTTRATELEQLAVTADVWLMSRDLKAVTRTLYAMMAIDRDAFLTRRALSRLLTQPYGDVWRQWPDGLLAWAWGVLAERDDVWSRHAAHRGAAGLMDMAAAERICAAWRAAEPGNPFAHDCLTRILERQGRLQEALAASRAAIEAVSEGKLLLYRPGGWSLAAKDEEDLWARHAQLSLTLKDDEPVVAEPLEP